MTGGRPVVRWSPRNRCALMLGGLLAILPCSPAAAQDPEPIGIFVVDARGSLARYGNNALIAAEQGLNELPPRGFGAGVGAHLYPLRLGPVTIGIGAEAFVSRGRRTPTIGGEPAGPSAEIRFSSVAPQLSFNFGSRQGWSYISGGLGQSEFRVSSPDVAVPGFAEDRAKTINYGGGARWFTTEHVAFTFDVRIYAISPVVADATRPGRPRLTLMVFSAGASFK